MRLLNCSRSDGVKILPIAGELRLAEVLLNGCPIIVYVARRRDVARRLSLLSPRFMRNLVISSTLPLALPDPLQ